MTDPNETPQKSESPEQPAKKDTPIPKPFPDINFKLDIMGQITKEQYDNKPRAETD